MQDTFNKLGDQFKVYFPNVVGAIVILIVGWIIAAIVSAVVKAALRRTGLGTRLARAMGASEGGGDNASNVAGSAVFWLIMVFVLVAAFQALNLTLITQPLNQLLNTIFGYLPQIIGAGILLLIAWIIARIVRSLVVRGLRAARIDERVGQQVSGEEAAAGEARAVPLSTSLGEAAYWLVFLLFLPAILSALNLPGLLAPVNSLLNRTLGFIPNIVAAALILVIGWFVATLVRRIVAGLLAGVGLDRLSERLGIAGSLGSRRLSDVAGLLVYVLIIIPVAIAALNALQLAAVSTPASNMLNELLAFIPRIFAAAIIVGVSYVIARIIAPLIAELLEGFGFNTILARLGISREAAANERTPSELAGYAVFAWIMLFAAIQAANALQFPIVAQLIADFTVLAGRVLLAVVIFGLGLYLANLAAAAIRRSDASQADLLALAARIAVLVLAGAYALREIGLANEIVNLAFGLTLGAVAVAVAIAFGWGGREVAGRELERWIENRRSNPPAIQPPSASGDD
ncbi:MAG TPA: mechanosensitive ion channel [Dehalococcoidia bacterium]|nr:mechanosensitive ion channel [Dehalococcoidia bacterium]